MINSSDGIFNAIFNKKKLSFFKMPDALDEYFEYDAEEFLVSLALLITEGRTPECSVKGRAESFHCPPAQSRFPGTARHECSDKLAQVRTGLRCCWGLSFV